MKKFLRISLATAVALLTVICPMFSVNAATVGPYSTVDGGCITSIEMKTESSIGGEVSYFTSVVNSKIQGLDSRASIPYRTYGAIGSENTKMFVYSIGSENGLDFSRATVKQIVERFEEENPEWNALVAINGDFFDIEGKVTKSMGEPEFPMIQLGNVYKSNVLYGATGRGIVGTTADGKMVYYTVGAKYKELGYGTPFRFESKYAIQFFGENESNVIAEYPASPDYYPQGTRINFITPDSKARDFSGATVYVVKCDTYRRSHVGINGSELGTVGYFIEGEIVEVRGGKKDEKPQAGEVYIATCIPESYPLLKVGEHIKCQQKAAGEWADVENAIGFKQQILADGNCLLKNAYGTYNKGGDQAETLIWTDDIYEYPFCWKDRAAIGFREDGTPVLLVVRKSSHDGDYKNLGASYYEIAEQLKSLGCANGFLLDGGGSTTFVVRNEDGSFSKAYAGEGNGRAVANAVILAVRDESVPLPETDETLEVVLPTEPATEKRTEKKTEKPTQKQTDSSTALDESDTERSTSGGCGSMIAAPAVVIITSFVAVFNVNQRRRRD
jgi:hypothetical protein